MCMRRQAQSQPRISDKTQKRQMKLKMNAISKSAVFVFCASGNGLGYKGRVPAEQTSTQQ